MSIPLHNLRVLDFSRLLPGPYCTAQLVQWGAEVIKVEHPEYGGDYNRYIPPLKDEQSYLFHLLNAGKQSVALNWAETAAREQLYRLVATADVLVESFKPGAMEQWGLGPEEVRSRNPHLVYCRLTAFGQQGNFARRPAHDLNVLALSGLLHRNAAAAAGTPAVPPLQLADLAAGAMVATQQILLALLERARTGEGSVLDISMYHNLWTLDPVGAALQEALARAPAAEEELLGGQRPFYRLYATRDKRHMAVAAIEPRFWETLCQRLGAPDLVEHHLAQGAAAQTTTERLARLFAEKTLAEWQEIFPNGEACVDPVLTPQEAGQWLQQHDPGYRERLQQPSSCGLPFPPSLAEPRPKRAAPTLGRDTADILGNLPPETGELPAAF